MFSQLFSSVRPSVRPSRVVRRDGPPPVIKVPSVRPVLSVRLCPVRCQVRLTTAAIRRLSLAKKNKKGTQNKSFLRPEVSSAQTVS